MELQPIKVDSLDLTLGRLRLFPEQTIKRMAESLKSKGQLTPLVAAARPEGPVLVDGFVRRLAAIRLGLSELLVEVMELSDIQMKAQVYLRNRERGLTVLEECRLVHELNRTEGLSQVEIADLLERHKSWVCRRIGLYRALSVNLRDSGELTKLGGGSIRRLSLLPQRNQDELMAVVQRDHLSGTEAKTLFILWQKTRAPDGRRYLMEHPRQAIQVYNETVKKGCTDPRLSEGCQYLVDGLNALEKISLRLKSQLRKGIEPLTPEGKEVFLPVLQRSESASVDIFAACRQWLDAMEKRGEKEAASTGPANSRDLRPLRQDPPDGQNARTQRQHGAEGLARSERPAQAPEDHG